MKIHDRDGTNTLVVNADGSINVDAVEDDTQLTLLQDIREQSEAMLAEMRIMNYLLSTIANVPLRDIDEMRGDPAAIIN